MTTLLSIAGGLLAVAFGAWLNDRIKRARPMLIPTSIRRTVDVIPHGSVVTPNSELLTTCSEHPFLASPPFEGIGKVDENAYVAYLTDVQTAVDDSIRVQLPAIAERAQQLQMKLAADDFEGVAHIWIDADRLWNYAEGAFVREEFRLVGGHGDDRSVPPAQGEPDDDPEPQLTDCEMATSPDGTELVYYPEFVLPLKFTPKARAGLSGERSSELAKRMAFAFAHRQKPDLIKVFNFLAGIEREIPKLEAINQRIGLELKRLTRLSVTALIGNTGSNPVSISKQTCTAKLLLSGYTYNIAEDDQGKPRERSDDIELAMTLVDDEGYPIPPLAIAGGGVQPVTAVYRTPLSAERLPEGGNLYELLDSALQGAERKWQLEVDAVLQRNASKPIVSRKIPFRDIQSSDSEVVRTGHSEARKRVAEAMQQVDTLSQFAAAQASELSSVRAELSTTRSELYDARRRYEGLVVEFEKLLSQQAPDGDGDGEITDLVEAATSANNPSEDSQQ